MTKTYKEHEEAPSGEVFFYNYKEPLMKFNGGYGYEGALIYDASSQQIQCHFCGWWGDTLQHHIHREHNMSASEYKKKVGLNTSTALISEPFRAKLIAVGLEKRLKNIRPGVAHTEEAKRKIRATLKENRSELKNQRNTCPEQLLERLTNSFNKYGRTPTQEEAGDHLFGMLRRTYGTVEEACKIAGIPYRKPSESVNHSLYGAKWTRDVCVAWVKDFYIKNDRLPKRREMPHGMLNVIYTYWNIRDILKQAVLGDGSYKKVEMRFNYTKAELITFLRIFEKVNGRRPSYSDCKRGLLPNLSRYSYNFGSWKEAQRLAFGEIKA